MSPATSFTMINAGFRQTNPQKLRKFNHVPVIMEEQIFFSSNNRRRPVQDVASLLPKVSVATGMKRQKWMDGYVLLPEGQTAGKHSRLHNRECAGVRHLCAVHWLCCG